MLNLQFHESWLSQVYQFNRDSEEMEDLINSRLTVASSEDYGKGNTGNDRYSGKNGQGFLFHWNGRFHYNGRLLHTTSAYK